MTDNVVVLLSSLLSTLLGGVIAIVGNIVTQKHQYKKEKTMWTNEKRLDLYADLISLLDSIKIKVEPVYDENFSIVELKTEVEYVKTKLAELLQFTSENNGKLLLFLPNGVNSNLVKLSGDIYSIIANEQKQRIDFSNYEESDIWKAVEQAKSISNKLKDEINK